MKRGADESFLNFESRFAAQVSKFNSHSSDAKLPEALTSFMLLANSNIDNNQRISILAAACPKEDSFTGVPTTTDYLGKVSYESIATVVRQCEKKSDSNIDTQSVLQISAGNATSAPRRRWTAEEVQTMKNSSQCRRAGCGKYGHWYKDHLPDGSLSLGQTRLKHP